MYNVVMTIHEWLLFWIDGLNVIQQLIFMLIWFTNYAWYIWKSRYACRFEGIPRDPFKDF